MARRRRQLSKPEVLAQTIKRCSDVLAMAYRHEHVNTEDIRAILGALLELHVNKGANLRMHNTGD